MTEEEQDHQTLLDEQRKRSLQVIIELANLLHKLTIEERTGFLLAVNTLVAGLDAMPAELGARALFSPETEKLVVVFDEDPDREPVIIDLMPVEAVQ